MYGITTIWGATYKSYFNKISTLQNKAVKVVPGNKYYDLATPFYINLKVLKVSDIYKHEIIKSLFRHIHYNSSVTFSKFFVKAANDHSRATDSRSVVTNSPFTDSEPKNCSSAISIKESKYGFLFLTCSYHHHLLNFKAD